MMGWHRVSLPSLARAGASEVQGCSNNRGLAVVVAPANGPVAPCGSIHVPIGGLPRDPGVSPSSRWPMVRGLGCGAKCRATLCALGWLGRRRVGTA